MKYRRNVGSLSIDMSADYRTNTLGRYVDRHIDRCIGQYSDRHIDRHISVDISAVCRSVCRPTYRSSIGRYVDQYIGRVSVDISTDTSVEGCTKYILLRYVTRSKVLGHQLWIFHVYCVQLDLDCIIVTKVCLLIFYT